MAKEGQDVLDLVKDLEAGKLPGWKIRTPGNNRAVITSPTGNTVTVSLLYDKDARSLQNARSRLTRAGAFAAQEAAKVAKKVARPAVKPAAGRATSGAALPPEAMPEEPLGMVTRTVLLTPELAEDYLGRPPAKLDDGTPIVQRTLDQDWVTEIASWIETGTWNESYEGLALAPDGGLLDGAHRCWAVSITGKAVRCRVTFNAPPELFAITNQGKKRSNAAILQTLGEERVRELSSALRMVWAYTRWTAGDHRFVTTPWNRWMAVPMAGPVLVQTLREHTVPKLVPELDIRESLSFGTVMRRLGGLPAAGIAWHHLAHLTWQGDPAILARFVEEMRTGAMLAEDNPALAARTRIAAMARKRWVDKRERQFLILIKAWLYASAGRPSRSLIVTDDTGMLGFPTAPSRRRSSSTDE